ncbi:hypothetical protein KJ870_09535 [bacterium]|jgi:hypothetical protein|nr:hypothetical protein [bacterium]MBU1435167.1 hypothetical protein [bacterium]MBU1502824.1 hypothetical protein [bacterium]
MAYLAGLIIAALFFMAMHYFTELTKSQKATATAVILTIILSAVAFNAYSESKQEQMMRVVVKYNQGKTVVCNGIDVNNTTYSLSVGTYTFIGLENTPNYGQMISASSCE